MNRAELTHIQLYLHAFGKFVVLAETPPSINSNGFLTETDSDRGPSRPVLTASACGWTPKQYTITFGHRTKFTPSFDLIDFTVFTAEPTP